MDDERHRYIAEWFDPSIKVKREFLLTYFPSDGSVEMFDRNLKKLFLKRIRLDSLDAGDIYVGSVVNILSRQLFITDFGDPKTREKFSHDLEFAVGFVKDSGFRYLGIVLDTIHQNGMSVIKGLIVQPDRGEISRSAFASELSSKFAVFELRGENAIEVWKKMLGLENALQKPINAELGSLGSHCLGARSADGARRELSVFFPGDRDLHCNTVTLRNSTCCIIKPHAVREGSVGNIIQDIIDEGFEITALEYINFDLPNASEFLEVYKGVVPFYQDMVSQLISGTCVAMEIVGNSSSSSGIVESFREFVGPMDTELARQLRPKTLRAKYGKDKIKNAIHCTDLPEDAKLEIEYVFRILAVP